MYHISVELRKLIFGAAACRIGDGWSFCCIALSVTAEFFGCGAITVVVRFYYAYDDLSNSLFFSSPCEHASL